MRHVSRTKRPLKLRIPRYRFRTDSILVIESARGGTNPKWRAMTQVDLVTRFGLTN